MSYIDELRDRFLAAEQQFGRISEAGREYRERLMGLMSRIEEEIRCRRDVEQQQAQEIERLTGENEELRTMLLSLLQAVETGNSSSLDETLGEMDRKVAALIGEGQGAPAATLSTPAEDDPVATEPAAARAAPIFSASDLMATPAGDTAAAEDEAAADPVEEVAAELVFEDDEAAQSAPTEDEPLAIDDAEATTAAPQTPEAAKSSAASEIEDFFGAGSDADDGILPAYAHPAGDWDDFLNEDLPAADAAASEPVADTLAADSAATEAAGDEATDALEDAEAGELMFEETTESAAGEKPQSDDVAETEELVFEDEGEAAGDETTASDDRPETDAPIFDEAGDTAMTADETDESDAGSIRELLDRVKSEIGGDDEDLDDDSNGDAAAAR